MATKLQQVPLVSANGSTQPPLPGGWALAIVNAIFTFAPGLAKDYDVSLSRSTKGRTKQGEPLTENTYEAIEKILVSIARDLFPCVFRVSPSAEKYVKEYLNLWTGAAAFGPSWTKAIGFAPAPTSVIARALVRDLVLRLCYLESCERRLRQETFSKWELSLLNHHSLLHVYRDLIAKQTRTRRRTLLMLAYKMRINEKSLRRFKTGKAAPTMFQLSHLKPLDENLRLIAGLGFIGQLLKKVSLLDRSLQEEILRVAATFLPGHRWSLESYIGEIFGLNKNGNPYGKTCDFEAYFAHCDNILLHPGASAALPKLPTALWRCHLYALTFACKLDLAHAYFQFSEDDNDQNLEQFLLQAETESTGCPYHWMEKLRHQSTVLPFVEGTAPVGS